MSGKKIRTLCAGMKGEDVRTVQKALNCRRPHAKRLHLDGDFGKETHKAVVEFQKLSDCNAHGAVDHECRSVLFPLVTATTTISLLRMRLTPPAAPKASATGAAQLLPVPRFPQLPSAYPENWLLERLPVPSLPGVSLPAVQLPDLGGFKFDSLQAQTGTSANLPPLDAEGNSVIVLQSVWARKHEYSDEQEQFTAGAQIQGAFTIPSDDGKDWTVSAFTQFTWADPFWRFGRLHLVQPFAQLTGQYDIGKRAAGFSLGLFPINVNLDLVGDGDISLYIQGGLVGNLQQKTRANGSDYWGVSAGTSAGLGVTFKLPQTQWF